MRRRKAGEVKLRNQSRRNRFAVGSRAGEGASQSAEALRSRVLCRNAAAMVLLTTREVYEEWSKNNPRNGDPVLSGWRHCATAAGAPVANLP